MPCRNSGTRSGKTAMPRSPLPQSPTGRLNSTWLSPFFFNRADDPEAGCGVDHVAVAEAMGCKAVRVRKPEEFAGAFKEAQRLMKEHQVPVVLEFILERVTNISMGTEIDKITEFEELAESHEDAPTAIVMLD